MYEAIPVSVARQLADGTPIEFVKPSEVGDRPRWFIWKEYANRPEDWYIDSKADLHTRQADDVDDKSWLCIVEVGSSQAPAQAASPAILTTDKKARKEMPIARGVVDYFPLALAEIARVSFKANEQHNPGEPMHWDKSKSTDHADCIARHLIERGGIDDDGLRHTAKLAWRAMALLQTELEAATRG